MPCAIYIRLYRDCAPNYLAYFSSRLSRLTKTFSTLILANYNAVFRLERATEVLELTYLGNYFACVNAN